MIEFRISKITSQLQSLLSFSDKTGVCFQNNEILSMETSFSEKLNQFPAVLLFKKFKNYFFFILSNNILPRSENNLWLKLTSTGFEKLITEKNFENLEISKIFLNDLFFLKFVLFYEKSMISNPDCSDCQRLRTKISSQAVLKPCTSV